SKFQPSPPVSLRGGANTLRSRAGAARREAAASSQWPIVKPFPILGSASQGKNRSDRGAFAMLISARHVSESSRSMPVPHLSIQPSILYFGTPVVLISTVNEDGTYNIAPMSSAFWLGWRCVLGLASSSKTTHNMIRAGECVLNLPSVEEVVAVNRL